MERMSLHLTFLLQCNIVNVAHSNVYNDFEIRKSSGVTLAALFAGLALLVITLWSCNSWTFLLLFVFSLSILVAFQKWWLSIEHLFPRFFSLCWQMSQDHYSSIRPSCPCRVVCFRKRERGELLAETFLGKQCFFFSNISMPKKA